MARVCRSLAARQRHTPSSLAAVIGLSNNDVISLRSFYVACVGLDGNAALVLRRQMTCEMTEKSRGAKRIVSPRDRLTLPSLFTGFLSRLHTYIRNDTDLLLNVPHVES